MADKKKKSPPSSFSLDNYKTHSTGQRGSPEQWTQAVRQALMLENPDATSEEIESKVRERLTKVGVRKIQID